MTGPVPVRPAATVLVLRDKRSVLMGQRGADAAFLPSKFVFPGGAIEVGDAEVPLAAPLGEPHRSRLSLGSDPAEAQALPAAAIRELYEETGLVIGAASDWPDAPKGWDGFAATGHRPSAANMSFVFRAVTPEGRPRRFDARFFLIDAADVASDLDDFSQAEDELSHLQWVPLKDARRFDLPFITEVVLAELVAALDKGGWPDDVPFFRNDDERHLVTRLGGRSPLEER